jgi:DNA-directed RNA polymerase subunit RPC12/RpoP
MKKNIEELRNKISALEEYVAKEIKAMKIDLDEIDRTIDKNPECKYCKTNTENTVDGDPVCSRCEANNEELKDLFCTNCGGKGQVEMILHSTATVVATITYSDSKSPFVKYDDDLQLDLDKLDISVVCTNCGHSWVGVKKDMPHGILCAIEDTTSDYDSHYGKVD